MKNPTASVIELILTSALLAGCASYAPLPLDHDTVAAKLQPPDRQTVRLLAEEIHHPILQPLVFDLDNGLSPDEAAILAVVANPKLRASRDQRRLAAAQLLQAGILPNPQLSYGLDIPTGGTTQGTVNAFNVGLGWEMTSILSRSAKVNAARAETASVDLDIAWQEWQTAQAAKQQVYHVYYLDRQLVVARQEEENLGENLDRIRRGANLGLVTAVDLAAAEAALQRIRATVLSTGQQREDERLALNQSLGFPAERIISLEKNISLPELPTLPTVETLTAGLETRRLDLLALKQGYESQEEKLRAAILGQFPKINIGFTHAGDTSNVITTGFGVTIDLPLFDRNQGTVAVEGASRAKLFDEYVARLFEARGEIARLVADLHFLQEQIDAAEKSLSILRNVTGSYREALLQGNADVLTYYSARAELTTKEMALLDLKRQLADTDIALEIAAGRYLGTASKRAVP